MRATLYTAYHKPAPRIASACVVPIHVGRAGAAQPLAGMIGDDTGAASCRALSQRNGAWCELTALHWAWRNDTTSSHLGLMHYRRLLDLDGRCPDGPVEAHPRSLDVAQWGASADAWLASAGADWDIVLPRLHKMGRTVEQNYRDGHQAQDWDLVRQIIRRDHPDWHASFEAVAASYEVRLGNMALMARPIFERYCTWLFDILHKVEAADLDRRQYSPTQARYLGFLAERLLTVFVHHLSRTEPGLRLREVSILNLSETVILPYFDASRSPGPEVINLAFAADRAYVPHAAAMLRSVLDHVDPARPLNLFFLHSGVDPEDLALLATLLEGHKAQLHPLDTGGMFEDSYRSASRAPSNATYNRFLLFALLPGLERLLYLDADVIVQRDIATLYDTDLGDAQLGAVPDWIMTRTLTGPTPTIDPDVPDLAAYHRDVLELSDAQIARYVNAGVLLFNFAAMPDRAALGQALMAEARQGRYLFRDQDILNRQFRDSLHLLDARWNVFNSVPAAYGRVPQAGHAAAMAARRDPWLIHYADRAYKPWQAAPVPRAELYWQALIRTPFYGEVVAGLRRSGARRWRPGPWLVETGRRLAERVPLLKGPLLRVYARARTVLGQP